MVRTHFFDTRGPHEIGGGTRTTENSSPRPSRRADSFREEEGDIMENSAYDEAKNEQAFVEGRILTVEQMLKKRGDD